MNIVETSRSGSFAVFLFMCLLAFVVWWTPIVSLPLSNIISTDIVATIWCGLVVLLSLQVGLSASDDVVVDFWSQVCAIGIEFLDLMRSLKTFSFAMMFTGFPILGITLGTWYFYFRIFGNEIFYDPVGYMILLPAVHWFLPLYLGIVLRNKSWLSWLSFR